MEGKISVLSSTVVFLAMMLTMSSSSAFDFYVGGRDGWVPNPLEAFSHWTERNRFQVNDTLVFRFKRGEDSVLVVNEADYRACNTSNPAMKLEGDYSIFKLDSSGAFFFISGAPGRCQQGQRLVVVVLSVRRRAGSSPSPRLAPSAAPAEWTSSAEASSPTAAISGSVSVASSLGIVVAALILSPGVFLL